MDFLQLAVSSGYPRLDKNMGQFVSFSYLLKPKLSCCSAVASTTKCNWLSLTKIHQLENETHHIPARRIFSLPETPELELCTWIALSVGMLHLPILTKSSPFFTPYSQIQLGHTPSLLFADSSGVCMVEKF